MATIKLVLDNLVSPWQAEELEDELADFLADLGYYGSVEEGVTGNSTAIRTKEEMEDG